MGCRWYACSRNLCTCVEAKLHTQGLLLLGNVFLLQPIFVYLNTFCYGSLEVFSEFVQIGEVD